MDVIRDMIQSVRVMKKRQIFGQIVSLGLIVTSALMIWKFLMVMSNSESPVVVVLSGSMEPSFRRGDILFLWMQSEQFSVGDIVVFKIDQREIPIVHRVHRVCVITYMLFAKSPRHGSRRYQRGDGDVDLLTKGDNNMVRACAAPALRHSQARAG
jgi:signal peptidase